MVNYMDKLEHLLVLIFFLHRFCRFFKIAGKTDKVNLELGIGVRNDDPILFDILQNQVENIDESFHQKYWITG